MRAESWTWALIALSLAAEVGAQEEPDAGGEEADSLARPATDLDRGADDLDRLASDEDVDEHDTPSTMLSASGGVLALPFAEACPFTGAACEPGEVAMAAGLHVFGRIEDFGVGAGFTYAAGLKTSEAAGAAILEREHSRSYLVLDGVFRYFPPELGGFTWWVGASIGAVVINDSWTTLSDREPYADADLIGPESLSLATEGFAAAVEVGGLWKFYDIWFVGTTIRYGNWLLPSDREATPLGDLASLAGRIDVIEAGLQLGFELYL